MPLLRRLRSFCLECGCNVVSIGNNGGLVLESFFLCFGFRLCGWLRYFFNGLEGRVKFKNWGFCPFGLMSLFASSLKFEVCPSLQKSPEFRTNRSYVNAIPTVRSILLKLKLLHNYIVLLLYQTASPAPARAANGPIRGGFLELSRRLVVGSFECNVNLFNWPSCFLRGHIFCLSFLVRQ